MMTPDKFREFLTDMLKAAYTAGLWSCEDEIPGADPAASEYKNLYETAREANLREDEATLRAKDAERLLGEGGLNVSALIEVSVLKTRIEEVESKLSILQEAAGNMVYSWRHGSPNRPHYVDEDTVSDVEEAIAGTLQSSPSSMEKAERLADMRARVLAAEERARLAEMMLDDLKSVAGDGTVMRGDLAYTRGYRRGREEAAVALSSDVLMDVAKEVHVEAVARCEGMEPSADIERIDVTHIVNQAIAKHPTLSSDEVRYQKARGAGGVAERNRVVVWLRARFEHNCSDEVRAAIDAIASGEHFQR